MSRVCDRCDSQGNAATYHITMVKLPEQDGSSALTSTDDVHKVWDLCGTCRDNISDHLHCLLGMTSMKEKV